MKPFWRILYNHQADVILSAHNHRYERYAPITPGGVADWHARRSADALPEEAPRFLIRYGDGRCALCLRIFCLTRPFLCVAEETQDPVVDLLRSLDEHEVPNTLD